MSDVEGKRTSKSGIWNIKAPEIVNRGSFHSCDLYDSWSFVFPVACIPSLNKNISFQKAT